MTVAHVSQRILDPRCQCGCPASYHKYLNIHRHGGIFDLMPCQMCKRCPDFKGRNAVNVDDPAGLLS